MLIAARHSQLLVVDMQARLLPAIRQAERVIARTRTLIAAAARLGVPVTVSEHYPQGLGRTVPELGASLPESAAVVEKKSFAVLGEPALAARLGALRGNGRTHLVVCGAEAHVCVLQSAIASLAAGYAVAVVADAVSSRSARDARFALDRLRQAGATIVSTEMIIFEWLERGGTEEFRALLPLIK
jgi:nicotinamidase-related amidase